jgi:hypothetical protein
MAKNDRWRRVACSRRVAFALLIAAATFSCRRADEGPVADFGGALATALPHDDVVGLLRLAPADATTDLLTKQAASAARLFAVLRPAATMLELERDRPFLAASEPLVVLLLDPSVHGALAAFAWRGAPDRFLASVRAAGLVVGTGGDVVDLPGRGRELGLEAMASDLLVEVQPGGGVEPANVPRVRYHLVERDGCTLLMPARDGALHLADTLAATKVLDESTGRDPCLRLAIGRVVEQLGSEPWERLDFAIRSALDHSIGRPFVQRLFAPRPDELVWRTPEYRRARRQAYQLVQGTRELLESTDELFVLLRRRDDGGEAEVALHAASGRLLDRVVHFAVDQPLASLVAGLPDGAATIGAFSCDPKRFGDVERAWLAATRLPGARPLRDVDAARSDDAAPEFLATFGGRVWLSHARRDGAPETYVRLFTQLVDDDANEGLLRASIRSLVSAKQYERLAPWLAFGCIPVRVEGGCVEHVGLEAAAAKVAPPSRTPLALPLDVGDRAFLFARTTEFGLDGWTTLHAADHGVRAHVRWR